MVGGVLRRVVVGSHTAGRRRPGQERVKAIAAAVAFDLGSAELPTAPGGRSLEPRQNRVKERARSEADGVVRRQPGLGRRSLDGGCASSSSSIAAVLSATHTTFA